jgi:hypothetical protein
MKKSEIPKDYLTKGVLKRPFFKKSKPKKVVKVVVNGVTISLHEQSATGLT